MNKLNSNYLRIATGLPETQPADIAGNTDKIALLYEQATAKNINLITFPELSITGYSIGDLVQNNHLLGKSLQSLDSLASLTSNTKCAMIVGLPIQANGKLYNCAALLANGKIMGVVPKQYLPNYSEFYEQRWFSSPMSNHAPEEIEIAGQAVPFGVDIVFSLGKGLVGIEICEDLWVADPPSKTLSEMGALIIANLSASPELVGKANYRKQLVQQASAKLLSAYMLSSAGFSESTTDIVMGGHQIIAENGVVVAETKPFAKLAEQIIYADIDLERLQHDRLKNSSRQTNIAGRSIDVFQTIDGYKPEIMFEKNPFLPKNENPDAKNERLKTIVDIQAHGLATRLKRSGINKAVLGLSGGLDSTLALLVCCQTAEILGKTPAELITTITMPGLGSANRTQNNAQKLAEKLAIKNVVIPISDLALSQLQAIDSDTEKQDITYENTQARIRTSLLFNYANKHGALVIGTGDLSELALGWCTYGGDQLSNYNVNSSVPKTLVKELVNYCSNLPEFTKIKEILTDIIDTPVSPELTDNQLTEDIIGPYELHDFFLYNLIRWGDSPDKIKYQAISAFADSYSQEEISKWLSIFLKRFTQNQFKRSAMPDGPKIGSIALSPRGDWRMPSDSSTSLWSEQ